MQRSKDEPTSYQVKQVVKGIKRLAEAFAREQGNDEFLRRIDQAMDSERRTVARRFSKEEVADGANATRLE